MRYAREADTGAAIVLFDIVDVPTTWEEDPEGFLTLLRPGITGYLRVADNNVPGAVKQSDGSYINPQDLPPAA